jgi:hypothetical protein
MDVNTSDASKNKKEGYACYPFQIGDGQAWPLSSENSVIDRHIAGRPRRWSTSFPNSRRLHIGRNYEATSTVLEIRKCPSATGLVEGIE